MLFASLSAPINRRRFLATGCKAAVGVTAVALTQNHLFAGTSNSAELTPLISIGFAAALPKPGAPVRLADAKGLLLPDPTFLSHGARVKVLGSARGSKHHGEQGGLAVDVVMPARFGFWSAAGNGVFDNVSGDLSFTTPVQATSGINFVARRLKVTAKPSSTPPPDVDPVPFTLSLLSGGTPKLQRGVYVVALRESPTEILTDWSRFNLVATQDGYHVTSDDFAWVILGVDYAK